MIKMFLYVSGWKKHKCSQRPNVFSEISLGVVSDSHRMGFNKPPHRLAQVKITPVQRNAQGSKRFNQRVFVVDGDDDIRSAEDGSEVHRPRALFNLLQNDEVTFTPLVRHEGVDDRKRRPI